tara:strand:+ start:441 stop:659 length:219 start_codon:yes stop_codon:yes gene_type:complete
MKSIIIFNLLVISIFNLTVIAHENHDHQIYNWSNSKNKALKTEGTVNSEKLEDKNNKTQNNNKSSRIKIFRK